MRILIAYEEQHRAYRDTIAEVLVSLRPHAQVEVSGVSGLGEAVSRLDPHVVIADSPNVVDPGGRPAWVQLPADTDESAGLCIGGDYKKITNPGLEELLDHVDEAERRTREDKNLGGC